MPKQASSQKLTINQVNLFSRVFSKQKFIQKTLVLTKAAHTMTIGLASMMTTVALSLPYQAHAEAVSAPAKVSVSNHPLYLLSQAVTKGTESATIKLLDVGDVGHHGSLSPQDKKDIKDSQFVVWFGADLEQNLTKALNDAPNAIALFDFKKGFTRYPRRDVTATVIEGSKDPHIWLDPNNAKAIVRALAVIHGHANPSYSDAYQKNVKAFEQEMDTLVAKHNKNKPAAYWASHDAFQYIEAALNMKLAGTLTTDHEIPPKASQILWLKQNRPTTSMCLLSQGKQTKGIINKLNPVKTQVLIEDMSGHDSFTAAWDAYATAIETCLK